MFITKSFMKTVLLIGAIVLSGTFLVSQPAFSEKKYPARTVEAINQFGPGGGTDIFIRAIGMPFAKIAKQSLIPVSITGGGGVPAATEFFNRPADGYTMMAVGPEEMINHCMGRIDAEKFQPVARIQYDQGLFFVPAKSTYKTIQDVIDYAKQNPGKLSISFTGAAGFDEVLVGLWNLRSGAELKALPFDGASEAIASALGGHTDLVYEEYGPMRPLIESGRLRPLVLFADQRLPVLEDVPTAKELGIDITLGRWRGFAVKQGTKDEQVEALAAIFAKAVKDPIYKNVEEQNMLQFRSEFLGPEGFKTFIDNEIQVYGDVLKRLGYIK
jgi:putative tricarboxylic transport membrane protein